MLRRLVMLGAAAGAAGFAVYRLAVEPWYRDWGADNDAATKALPGDDLVTDPSAIDTRTLDIAAPPEAVWPWLVQMGYGRAGWYSYDTVDMRGKSVDAIVPEWQSLAVGDLVTFDPTGGGFEVKVLDPGRSLVLYLDGDMLVARAKAAADSRTPTETTPGIRATGSVLGAGFPADFAASWAFDLEPLGDGRTRLVERFRIHMGEGTPVSRLAAPLMGFGVFVMTRKHMLGIRDRVERAAAAGASAPPAPVAVPVVGEEPPLAPSAEPAIDSAASPA